MDGHVTDAAGATARDAAAARGRRSTGRGTRGLAPRRRTRWRIDGSPAAHARPLGTLGDGRRRPPARSQITRRGGRPGDDQPERRRQCRHRRRISTRRMRPRPSTRTLLDAAGAVVTQSASLRWRRAGRAHADRSTASGSRTACTRSCVTATATDGARVASPTSPYAITRTLGRGDRSHPRCSRRTATACDALDVALPARGARHASGPHPARRQVGGDAVRGTARRRAHSSSAGTEQSASGGRSTARTRRSSRPTDAVGTASIVAPLRAGRDGARGSGHRRQVPPGSGSRSRRLSTVRVNGALRRLDGASRRPGSCRSRDPRSCARSSPSPATPPGTDRRAAPPPAGARPAVHSLRDSGARRSDGT